MAAVNRVKMPTNMKLRQRESHMLASSAADAVAAASAFPMQTSNGGSAACAQNGIELSATHAAAGASINTDGCTKTGTHQAGGPGAAVLRSALPVRGTQQRLAQQAKLALQTTGVVCSNAACHLVSVCCQSAAERFEPAACSCLAGRHARVQVRPINIGHDQGH